jgi:SMODS-associating 4TM effector domain
MDNGIIARQNSPANIRLLAAQRSLYSRAKWVATVQACVAGLTPLAGATAVAANPHLDVWAAFAGIVVALFDTAWLDPWQSRLRNLAANVQEAFDCEVLQLPWNDVLAGRRPSPEDIYEAAEGYKPSSAAPLEDWYPQAAAALPLYQGRLICQRTNCWWDSKLRRRYSNWVVAAMSFLSVSVVAIGMLNGISLQKFVLAVMAPLLPAALWATREWQRQRETAVESDRRKEYSESLWDQVVRAEVAEPEVSTRSRQLQDSILVLRRESALVFDWVYRCLRGKHEEQMNVGAERMVHEIGHGNGTAAK